MEFPELVRKRRTIYALGKDVGADAGAIVGRLQEVAAEVPSAYNSQSQRAVILLDREHDAFWDIVRDALIGKIGKERYSGNTSEKVASFKAANGTILFFEDRSVTSSFVERFPSGTDNFPKWALQANGMMQYAFWLALAEMGVGASLQHYDPLIDDAVRERWNLPSEWTLLAQMPFGSVEAGAGAKEYMPIAEKVRVFGR